MESVMNFLADYYIWFFVVAGILCIALIGFIAESKKKQKNDFKGDSIEESSKTTTETPVVESTNTVTEAPTMESVAETPVMETPVMETPSTEETMEINDIPISTPESTSNESSQVEFYSGPIEMPKVEPASENVTMETPSYQESTPVENQSSVFDSTPSLDNGSINSFGTTEQTEIPNIQTESVMPEEGMSSPVTPEETQTTNIFDNIK